LFFDLKIKVIRGRLGAEEILAGILLIIVVLYVACTSFVKADIPAPMPPQGSCQFVTQTYLPGQPVVVLVNVATRLYQPILEENTPQGQVNVSLGNFLDMGDYSFTVGTATPPSGFMDAVLLAKSGYGGMEGTAPTPIGNYQQVGSCSYNVVPEFNGATELVLTLVFATSLLLLRRERERNRTSGLEPGMGIEPTSANA
jgi:hypothetical protein